jgi:hypothetical protein
MLIETVFKLCLNKYCIDVKYTYAIKKRCGKRCGKEIIILDQKYKTNYHIISRKL